MDNVNGRMDRLYIQAMEYCKAMEMNKLLACIRSCLNNDNAEMREARQRVHTI